MTTTPIHVALVDDDDAVRKSLAAMLATWRFEVSTFSSGTSFLAEVDLDRADCLLLDVRLPDMSGLDLLARLRAEGAETPVIMLTGHGDVAMAVKALQTGAQDFIEKPFDGDELARRIQQMALARRRLATERSARAAPFERLTRRETEVMRAVVAGCANKVIAQDLQLSPKTVELHRRNVMEKTGARNVSELVRMAVLAGVGDGSSTGE